MGICVVSTRLMWISQDDTMYTRGASWLALKCYSTQDLTGVPVPWCDVTRPQPGTDYSPPCLSKGVLLLFDYIEGELLKWKETPKCTLGGGIIPADLLRPCRNFFYLATFVPYSGPKLNTKIGLHTTTLPQQHSTTLPQQHSTRNF